jgi:hypothetical protein
MQINAILKSKNKTTAFQLSEKLIFIHNYVNPMVETLHV